MLLLMLWIVMTTGIVVRQSYKISKLEENVAMSALLIDIQADLTLKQSKNIDLIFDHYLKK